MVAKRGVRSSRYSFEKYINKAAARAPFSAAIEVSQRCREPLNRIPKHRPGHARCMFHRKPLFDPTLSNSGMIVVQGPHPRCAGRHNAATSRTANTVEHDHLRRTRQALEI
jgi:hypothetical protein